MIRRFCVAALMTCGLAVGQAPVAVQTEAAPAASAAALTFDVATVRPSLDFNSPAMQAAMRAGNMPKFGANVEGLRAEYNQMQLRDLIANAYEVKTYQVSGPDVLTGQRFDIAARLPEGSTASDAPKMLKALLQERFKLEVTVKTEDRAVLGLAIVGKSGPKMKSVAAPPPLDEKAELAPGQRKIDTPIGPAIMTMRQGSGGGMGGATMNMGSQGTMTYTPKIEGQSFTLHMDFSGVTMPALAAMLSQFLMGGPGGGTGKPVVDATGLAGNYDTALDFSPQMNMGGGGQGAGAAGAAPSAPDPAAGASSIYDSVQKMGLKLDQRKAPLEQVVVTHVEKTPTDN